MRRGETTLADRLGHLREAVDAADGHLPLEQVQPARDLLAKAGAREGDAVTIGDVTFDWAPTLPAGTLTAEESAGLGGRGTDNRLESNERVGASERLAAKRARRVPFEATEDGWTDEELAAAGHLEDLPAREHAYLWIDARHHGVGSGAVGPDVSAPHRIGPGTYRWSYRLR